MHTWCCLISFCYALFSEQWPLLNCHITPIFSLYFCWCSYSLDQFLYFHFSLLYFSHLLERNFQPRHVFLPAENYFSLLRICQIKLGWLTVQCLSNMLNIDHWKKPIQVYLSHIPTFPIPTTIWETKYLKHQDLLDSRLYRKKEL